jgi:hypothetical protein
MNSNLRCECRIVVVACIDQNAGLPRVTPVSKRIDSPKNVAVVFCISFIFRLVLILLGSAPEEALHRVHGFRDRANP